MNAMTHEFRPASAVAPFDPRVWCADFIASGGSLLFIQGQFSFGVPEPTPDRLEALRRKVASGVGVRGQVRGLVAALCADGTITEDERAGRRLIHPAAFAKRCGPARAMNTAAAR